MFKCSAAAFAAIIMSGGLVAQAPAPAIDLEMYAKPQRLVTLPDKRKMNLHCTGTGSPTVLLEGGWTTTTSAWRDIQPRIAATTSVCSYDRAGYGFSDPGPLPRSASAIADDLQGMLRAAKRPGPYIIVAHSIGGLDARLFTDRNRRSVAGMVLIDPSAPFQDRKLAKVSPATAKDAVDFERMVVACADLVISGRIKPDAPESRICVSPPSKSMPASLNAGRRTQQLTAAYQRSATSELTSFNLSSGQVEASRRSYGAMPLIVLSAGQTANPDLPADEQQRVLATWWEMHADVAGLSTRGQHRLVKDASHFIPKEQPDLVVAAINELVLVARTDRKAR